MANNLLGLYCLSYNQLTQNAPIVINEENIAMVVPSGTGSLVIYEETDGTSSEIVCQDTIGQITQATALLLSTNPSTINGVSVTGTVLVNPGNINVITSVTGDTNSGGSNVTIEVSGTPGTVLGELTQSQDSFNPSWSYSSIASIPTELQSTNLKMHFDAGDSQNIFTDSNGNVSEWYGENGFILKQNDVNARPSYDSINGRVTFADGEYLELFDSSGNAVEESLSNGSASFFIVANLDSSNASQNFLGGNGFSLQASVTTSGGNAGDFNHPYISTSPGGVGGNDIRFNLVNGNGQTSIFNEIFADPANLVGNKVLFEYNIMNIRQQNSGNYPIYGRAGFFRTNGVSTTTPATNNFDEGQDDAASLEDLTVNAGFAFAPPTGFGGSIPLAAKIKIVGGTLVGGNYSSSYNFIGSIHEIAVYDGPMYGDGSIAMTGPSGSQHISSSNSSEVPNARNYDLNTEYSSIASYFKNKHSLSSI
tara:strand:- start:59 stop:1492 length:1434 start_codon:yes stop_codon:yes gene_type:complete